jgi:hypothetical protein
LFPNHQPEVICCVRQRSLARYVLLLVARNKISIYVVGIVFILKMYKMYSSAFYQKLV